MTTTTAPASTARSITTAVRRAIRLAGLLDSVIKVNTGQARTGLLGEISTHWSTIVETTSREEAERITAALGAQYPVAKTRFGMNFSAVEIAQPIATPVAENSETNAHHVAYTNANGYDGTVLIERGTNRRTHALEQAASIRRSGGHVHEVIEIHPDGRRVAVDLPPVLVADAADDDYRGDSEALATELRIVTHRMTKVDDYDLRWSLRKRRLHLLRIQVARAGLRITGDEARELRQHVTTYVKPDATWSEVQAMRRCGHGCKLYVRVVAGVEEFALIHFVGYGCPRGPETVPVTVD